MAARIVRTTRRTVRPGFFQVTMVADTLDDVGFIDTGGLIRPGNTNNALSFQSIGGSMEISFTTEDPRRATNPDSAVQATIAWKLMGTIAAKGDFLPDTDGATPTAVRVKFTSAPGGVTINSL